MASFPGATDATVQFAVNTDFILERHTKRIRAQTRTLHIVNPENAHAA